MIEGLFHNWSGTGGSQFSATAQGGRRGGRNKLRPSRLVHAARRGVTLVELLISMLILTIVCLAWLQIIGIQSARKEARRREAVERLVGMMDAFLHENLLQISFNKGSYEIIVDTTTKWLDCNQTNDINYVNPVFEGDVSPIGYRLYVIPLSEVDEHEKFGGNWKGKWLVGKLYNRSNCSEADAGKPFFTLPVCLGL